MKKVYVVLNGFYGCPPRKPRPLTRLEKAYRIIAKIKTKSVELKVLNIKMADPMFVTCSRSSKTYDYNKNVRLVRELEALGLEIEALGFKLEPSDLA